MQVQARARQGLQVLVVTEPDPGLLRVVRVLQDHQFQLRDQPQIMQAAAVAVAGFLIPLAELAVQVVAVQVVVEVEVHLELREQQIQVAVVVPVL